jgi:aminocarboxymuconate-semialdehyde decarboxylase
MTTIDLHAHVVPDSIWGQAGHWGPEKVESDGTVGFRVGKYQALRLKVKPSTEGAAIPAAPGPKGHIERMDRAGWDVHVITPSVLFFMYWAEPEIGIPFARLHNDALAEFCDPYPERLFFQATLPLQDVDASLEELDRVVEMGAKGIYVGASNLAGREIDDEVFFPIWRKIQDLDVPVMIHACPEAVPGEREDPYLMTSFMGTIYDETKAFCNLIFGGILDQFPYLKFYISHGGGFIPYQLGRVEAQSKVMSDGKNRKPVRDYLDNFYFDLLLADAPAQKAMLETVDARRLVAGDNFGGADDVDAIGILDTLELRTAERELVLHGNAAELYKLPV